MNENIWPSVKPIRYVLWVKNTSDKKDFLKFFVKGVKQVYCAMKWSLVIFLFNFIQFEIVNFNFIRVSGNCIVIQWLITR